MHRKHLIDGIATRWPISLNEGGGTAPKKRTSTSDEAMEPISFVLVCCGFFFRQVCTSSLLILNSKMRSSICSSLALLASSPVANGWGFVGHATVATIADHYLTSQARTYVSSLLGSGVTMASVASWADDYRYTTAGKFSAPFHYIGQCPCRFNP